MSSLPTLIKLEKHRMEAVQKELVETRAAIEAIDAQVLALEEELLRGSVVAAAMNDAAVFGQAAAFVKMAKKKTDILKQRKKDWEAILAKQLEKLNFHFAAQKRYETLHQRKEAAAKRQHEAKLQKMLDEAASIQYATDTGAS